MKICVLGNSHTGALKRSWDELISSEFKERYDITFFAARSNNLADLRVKNGELVTENEITQKSIEFTSGGLSTIKLDAYDAYLIYGFVRPYIKSDSFYSNRVTSQSIKDHFINRTGYQLLKKIRMCVETKVYLGHIPFPSSEKQDNWVSLSHTYEQYEQGVNIVNNNFFEEMNSTLIKQPSETLAKINRNTLSKFSKGSLRLAIGESSVIDPHWKADNVHMNDEFGKIWLENFLNTIEELTD
jgi:hypothetical protein